MTAVRRVAGEPAYVLRRHAYRETSLLLEVFSREHGRVGLVARGARRPKSPMRHALQAFSPLLLDWQQRGELGTLTAAEPGGQLPALRGDAVYCGWYLNELLLRTLQRDDPHGEAFSAYAEALSGLAHGALEPALRRFEKQLLDEIGYGLELPPTLRAEARYRYDWELGPIEDADADPGYDGGCLLALAAGDELDAGQLTQAKRLLRAALKRVLGDRELESVRAIREMRRLQQQAPKT